MFVSLFTKAAGPAGAWLKPIALGVFGAAGYALPFLLALLGLVVIIAGYERINWWRVLAWTAFAVAGLALLNISRLVAREGTEFLEFTVSAFQVGVKEPTSGGALGAVALYFVEPLVGKAGTIILFVLVMLSIVVTNTGLSLRKLGTNVKSTADTVIARQQQRRVERRTPGLFVGSVSGTREEPGRKQPDLALLNTTKFETAQQVGFDDEKPLFGIDAADFGSGKPEERPALVAAPRPEDGPKPEPRPLKEIEKPKPAQEPAQPAFGIETAGQYVKPPFNLLTKAPKLNENVAEEINRGAARLEETLLSFGVNSKVVNVSRGPAVTRYELQPAPGVKISRIVNLSNDIALSMAAPGVRIEAPIPGKAAIGVEVPNTVISMVKLRDVLESQEFQKADAALTCCLGKDIAGKNVVTDLAKMPHLLIAGSTGSGKSVCINTLIVSVLYKSSPDDVRMILIDPKVVELNVYNGVPHLLIPVVTEPKKAAGALNWAVQEMTRRYTLFAEKGARDLQRYNQLAAEAEDMEKLPQIVIVIDELADLMMVAPNEVEDSICRLAQMARAAGMHLVIATQRPSVDVITGVIKANIPSRIAFAVSSQVDSRTILDMSGAEKLLGRGDMLFNPSGSSKPIRVQGAYITENEVEKVVEFIKQQHEEVDYDSDVLSNVNSFELPGKGKKSSGGDDEDDEDGYSERRYDALLLEAAEVVFDTGQASISMVQRRLRVGYARAARLVDEMEELGIVSPSVGSKPREILKSRSDATSIIEQYRG